MTHRTDMLALLHEPPPGLARCERTFVAKDPIDLQLARRQHASYAGTLRNLGLAVRILNVSPHCPDAVFVEDVAIILDEVAIIASMGAPARRRELDPMAAVIAQFRDTVRIRLPATIEGGDVLRAGRTLFVGESRRTNRAGMEALRRIAEPLGYAVVAVRVTRCLHLKTCLTALDAETLLVHRPCLAPQPLAGRRLVDVDPAEPAAANALAVNDKVLINAACPRTADVIEAIGYTVRTLDISEFTKAEGGLTCMSLIVQNPGSSAEARMKATDAAEA